MPYRSALLPCIVCDRGLATERCARCRGPLCLEHLPSTAGRCNACELDFQVHLARLPLTRWWWAGFAVVLPSFLLMTGPLQQSFHGRGWAWGAFTAGIAVGEALLITLLTSALLATALVRLRVHWERRSFLAD